MIAISKFSMTIVLKTVHIMKNVINSEEAIEFWK